MYPYAPILPVGFTTGAPNFLDPNLTMQTVMQASGGILGGIQQAAEKIANIPVVGQMVLSMFDKNIADMNRNMAGIKNVLDNINATIKESNIYMQQLLYINSSIYAIQKQAQQMANLSLNLPPNVERTGMLPLLSFEAVTSQRLYATVAPSIQTFQTFLFSIFGFSPSAIRELESLMLAPYYSLNTRIFMETLAASGRLQNISARYGILPTTLNPQELYNAYGTATILTLGTRETTTILNEMRNIIQQARTVAQNLRTTSDVVLNIANTLSQTGNFNINQTLNMLSSIPIRLIGGNISDLYNNLTLSANILQRMNTLPQFGTQYALIAQMLAPSNPQLQQQILTNTLTSLAYLGGPLLSNLGILSFINNPQNTNYINILTSGAQIYANNPFLAPLISQLIASSGNVFAISRLLQQPLNFYSQALFQSTSPLSQLSTLIAMGIPAQSALQTIYSLQYSSIADMLTSLQYNNATMDELRRIKEQNDILRVIGSSLYAGGAYGIAAYGSMVPTFLASVIGINLFGRIGLRGIAGALDWITNMFGIQRVEDLKKYSEIGQMVASILMHLSGGPEKANKTAIQDLIEKVVEPSLGAISSIANAQTTAQHLSALGTSARLTFSIMRPFIYSTGFDILSNITTNISQQLAPGIATDIATSISRTVIPFLPFLMFALPGNIALLGGLGAALLPFAGGLIQGIVNSYTGGPGRELIITPVTPGEQSVFLNTENMRRMEKIYAGTTTGNIIRSLRLQQEGKLFSIGTYEQLRNAILSPELLRAISIALPDIYSENERNRKQAEQYVQETFKGILNTFNFNLSDERLRESVSLTIYDIFKNRFNLDAATAQKLTQNIVNASIQPSIQPIRLDHLRQEIINKKTITPQDVLNLAESYNVSPEFVFKQIQATGAANKLNLQNMKEWERILGASTITLPQFQETIKKRIEDVRRFLERTRGLKIETTEQLLNILQSLDTETITIAGNVLSVKDLVGQIKLMQTLTTAPQTAMDLSTPEKINYETARLLKETAVILEKLSTK